MSKICDTEKCTGCLTCMNSCPKDAIKIVTTSLGKTIPFIDEEKCINCNLCIKKCPVNNDVEGRYPIECYATQWKSDMKKDSASGGVATAFAHYAINNGIHIFGSIFDNELNLSIQELINEEYIKKAAGSKYIQSSVDYSYRAVKEYILNDEKVIYIGTPCQIDGLNNFLGKKFKNLLTIDIVCHGVPPFTYFKRYLDEKKYNNISSASFRGKNDYYLCLFNDTNLIYKKWHKRDLYFQAFDEGIINRDNCYNCRYANPNRVSDITIGDFWGLNRSTLSTGMNGKISVVLINSERGKDFWEEVQDLFVSEPREIEEAVKGNPHLHKCNPANENYKIFSSNFEKLGFSKSLIKTGIRKRMFRLWLRDTKKKILNRK